MLYHQISTNAVKVLTNASLMPSALTPMDRIVVRVKQDILVMDIIAQVGLLSSLTA